MSLTKRCLAEFIGTFWLVFGGCGSAVLAAAVQSNFESTPFNVGIGFVGVALAFGLTVLTMAYAIGHISGCHLNPAVTAGLTAGGRFPAADALPYVVSQVVGGIAARIAGYARGGQVLCSETVLSAARAAGVPMQSLGPVGLKNLREPLELFALGMETIGGSPEQLAATVQSEMKKMGKVIRDAGIKVQ